MLGLTRTVQTQQKETMAQMQVTIDTDQLKDVLSHDQGLKTLLEEVLDQVLEAEMTEHIGAEPYERTEQRRTYRNGYRPRRLTTRVGSLTLRVPQSRDGSFSTELFRRYQRSEQALVLSLMEMVVQGVSTRKVTRITEQLCGTSFSKSTVSSLCSDLDARVEAWSSRPLKQRYPFLIVDAIVVKVRRDGAVRSTSVLVALGISEEGHREILGLDLGDSETEGTWARFFKSLKDRGLHGVDLIASDNHGGLVKAARRHFQGAIWQRCQAHFSRNVLKVTPKHLRAEMTAWLRRIFRSENQAEARVAFDALAEAFEGKAEAALEVLEEGLEDAIAVLVLPAKYRRRLRTTNMLERLNEELRRRERVIRIFPNEAAALRMIGALLVEQHEHWISGKRYFNMDEYESWRQARQAGEEQEEAPATLRQIA